MKSIGRIFVFCAVAIVLFFFNAEKHNFKPEMMYLILITGFIVFVDAERQNLNQEKGAKAFLGAGSLGWGLLTLLFLPLAFVYLVLRLRYTQAYKQINPSKSLTIVSGLIIIISSLNILLLICSLEETSNRLSYWYGYRIFYFLAYLISAINILLLKEWARKVIVALSCFTIIVISIVLLQNAQVDISLLRMLFETFIIFLFTRPKIKEQFRRN